MIFEAMSEIYVDIARQSLAKYKFRIEDGKVVYNGSLGVKQSLRDTIETLEIPGVTIHYISGSFSCSGCKKIKSLKGIPEIVRDNVYCTECPNLHDYKYYPKHKEC